MPTEAPRSLPCLSGMLIENKRQGAQSLSGSHQPHAQRLRFSDEADIAVVETN